MRFKLVLILVLASLALLFIAQNVAVVKVRFIIWAVSMHLSLFVILLFSIGAVVGWLLNSYCQHRRERAKNRLNAV